MTELERQLDVSEKEFNTVKCHVGMLQVEYDSLYKKMGLLKYAVLRERMYFSGVEFCFFKSNSYIIQLNDINVLPKNKLDGLTELLSIEAHHWSFYVYMSEDSHDFVEFYHDDDDVFEVRFSSEALLREFVKEQKIRVDVKHIEEHINKTQLLLDKEQVFLDFCRSLNEV